MGEARITAVVVGVWSFACAGRLTGLILRADGTDPPLIINPPFQQYIVTCVLELATGTGTSLCWVSLHCCRPNQESRECGGFIIIIL